MSAVLSVRSGSKKSGFRCAVYGFCVWLLDRIVAAAGAIVPPVSGLLCRLCDQSQL